MTNYIVYKINKCLYKNLKKKKQFRKLTPIAAFNVARQLSGQTDTQELPLPKTMKTFINFTAHPVHFGF